MAKKAVKAEKKVNLEDELKNADMPQELSKKPAAKKPAVEKPVREALADGSEIAIELVEKAQAELKGLEELARSNARPWKHFFALRTELGGFVMKFRKVLR